MEENASCRNKGTLGISQKDPVKLVTDFGEIKSRGCTPNKEKLKLDGEASGQLKIKDLLRVGKGVSLPKGQ